MRHQDLSVEAEHQVAFGGELGERLVHLLGTEPGGAADFFDREGCYTSSAERLVHGDAYVLDPTCADDGPAAATPASAMSTDSGWRAHTR